MSKPDHVPETRSQPKPNREQRRHPERFENAAEDAAVTRDREVQPDIVRAGNQDVQSTRAKNSGHGKKTADKWNQ
jgi:hypothetical protein